jgi:hypothetical protein
MTVLAEVQVEFGLIPEQAAAEIKIAYDNLEINQAYLKEAGDILKTTQVWQDIYQTSLKFPAQSPCSTAVFKIR